MDDIIDFDVESFIAVDIEIDDELVVEEAGLQQYNDFENSEIEIPDDVDASELEDLSSCEHEEVLPCLPAVGLTFVSEENISVVKETGRMMCEKCGRLYKRKKFFQLHATVCKGKLKALKAAGTSKKLPKKMSKPKQPKRKIHDQLKVTDEELIQQAPVIVKAAVGHVLDDPVHQMVKRRGKKETLGYKLMVLAEQIKLELQRKPDILRNLSEEIVGDMANIMAEIKFEKAASKELMWRKVAIYMKNEDHMKPWDELCEYISKDDVFPTFFHHVCMQSVHGIIKYQNEILKSPVVIDQNALKLTDGEQQTLYYVSGYIVHSLFRKYEKIKENNPQNDVAVAALQLLDSFKSSVTNEIAGVMKFLDFTRKWIDIVNRGGLVKVNDDFYIFIRRIENVVRLTLNIQFLKTYHGQDIRDVLQGDLQKNGLVTKAWDICARNMPNDNLKKIMKRQIIAKWIDIRANSFIVTYVQIIKRKLASMTKEKQAEVGIELSSPSEPALRKTLKH